MQPMYNRSLKFWGQYECLNWLKGSELSTWNCLIVSVVRQGDGSIVVAVSKAVVAVSKAKIEVKRL